MKLKTIPIKPLMLQPLKLQTQQNKFASTQSNILPDASNQPDPTPEKIQRFRENADQWIDTIVMSSLRKHNKTDVLHGSKSLQLLLGEEQYPREPKDYDIFSTQEKQRALQTERAIDKKAQCDIAQTRYESVKKVTSGQDDPYTGKHLYIVETPHIHDDPSVDYMDKPKNLPTQLKNRIRHEHLRVAHQKASTRIYRQPLKAHKALLDMRAIRKYYERQGKKLR